MFETFTYRYLHFRPPPSNRPLPSLPPGITRHFIPTPSGNIEILYAAPSKPRPENASPIFLVHGGMGGAWVWLEYLTYLSAQGIPVYALSLRGHGNSWHPSYLRMLFFTTKHMLATDAVAGMEWVQSREGGREVVYVGHSSGGGLGQYILSRQMIKVKALVLAAAVPGFGSLGVYINWWRLDPFFTLRMLFHFSHPNSPLSHPTLTRRAFFSPSYPESSLLKFQSQTSRYESYLWPFGMMRPFTDPFRLLSQITSLRTTTTTTTTTGTKKGGEKILVLAGELDKLMTPGVMRDLAGMYRAAYTTLVKQKKVDSEGEEEEEEGEVKSIGGEGEGNEKDSAGAGVRLVFVPGAGHHLQNDVTWEIGARKLVEFYRQL
ncbi:Alpha/Beta hydrolase protein [Cladorrhinum sp. PSN332]|nr:Alpha/Beta hydrolase protein [Cladorrhinum sp. PSN332]